MADFPKGGIQPKILGKTASLRILGGEIDKSGGFRRATLTFVPLSYMAEAQQISFVN